MTALDFVESIGNRLMVDSPEGILFKALFGLIVVLVGAIIYLIVARLIGGPSNLIARLCNSLFSIDEKGKQRSPEEDPYKQKKNMDDSGNTEK